jgi:maltose/moltooligosaccharide transporter
MGIFNFTIAGPQIVAGLAGKSLLGLFGGAPINMILLAGVSMLLAAVCVFFVTETTNKKIDD